MKPTTSKSKEERIACYCKKCKGARVSRSTWYRHGSVGEPLGSGPPAAHVPQVSFEAFSATWGAGAAVPDAADSPAASEESEPVPALEPTAAAGIATSSHASGSGHKDKKRISAWVEDVDDEDETLKRPRVTSPSVQSDNGGNFDMPQNQSTPPPFQPVHPDPVSPSRKSDISMHTDPSESSDSDSDSSSIGPTRRQAEEQARELERQAELMRRAEQFRLAEARLAQEEEAQRAAAEAAEAAGDPDPEYLAELAASTLERLDFGRQFMEQVQQATLDNGRMEPEDIERLRNPPTTLSEDVYDPDVAFSLDLYMSLQTKASEASYNATRDAIHRRFPPGGANSVKVLSPYSVKKLLSEITGIVPIRDDMCIDGCQAFTGPWSGDHECRTCQKPRWGPNPNSRDAKKNPQVPVQQMTTLLLGPQLQALRRSEEGSKAMQYRTKKLAELLEVEDEDGNVPVYDDIFCGADIRELAKKHGINEDDITIGFSIDGAQLYRNKLSDCWIAVWIVYDFDPVTRYRRKHILPALIVPGPNKPKNIDSYLFRSFHHLSGLQRENGGKGMRAWDHLKQLIILSRIFFLLGMADAIALTDLDGRAGHHAAHGCRLGCPFHCRYKEASGGHYFSAHLRPNGIPADKPGMSHPDFDFRGDLSVGNVEEYNAKLRSVLESTSQTVYENRRKGTGISKSSIISGLLPSQTLVPPKCFSVDLMHLLFLNLADLMIPLFRG